MKSLSDTVLWYSPTPLEAPLEGFWVHLTIQIGVSPFPFSLFPFRVCLHVIAVPGTSDSGLGASLGPDEIMFFFLGLFDGNLLVFGIKIRGFFFFFYTCLRRWMAATLGGLVN